MWLVSGQFCSREKPKHLCVGHTVGPPQEGPGDLEGPSAETWQEGLGRHGGPQGLQQVCLTNAGSFGNLFPMSVTDAVTELMAAPAGALV